MVEEEKVDILITGCTGRLGTDLCARLNKEYRILGINKQVADIRDYASIAEIISKSCPRIIIHTAAFTDVDGCEMDSDLAFSINTKGTENVSIAALNNNAVVVYISTDYVFDGNKDEAYKEDDLPNPVNVYGQTKLEGEMIVRNILKKYLIVRSSWFFGKAKESFVEIIINKAKQLDVISVVEDKYGTPCYTYDLAGAILKLINYCEKNDSWGEIIHVTNSGFCSWLEYAAKILEYAGIQNVQLIPIKQHELGFRASRPKRSVLDNTKYKSITGESLRPWQKALEEYIYAKNIRAENN
jgi:dTDP-4-dehydrorhamnose reductase